jgi:hypothetical protein
MDTNHYKVRPGEHSDTLAARALGARSAKDLNTVFEPYVSVGQSQETVWAYQDSRNPDRIAAVATSTERDFYSNTTERATVSVMSRKEWEAAYDRAEESTRPAHAAGDAHFVSALMREVGAEYPGRGSKNFEYFDIEEYQPRAPGRIKAAAAAAQAKTATPKPRAHQGDAR